MEEAVPVAFEQLPGGRANDAGGVELRVEGLLGNIKRPQQTSPYMVVYIESSTSSTSMASN